MSSRSTPGPRLPFQHNPTPASGAPRIFIGTSGWAYPTWKPGFYPAVVSQKKFLSYYASQLNSVEVNYTFRALPTASMCENWLSATPPGFRFSFKAPQRITHFQRLRESQNTLKEFLAALEPFRVADKFGLVLFQLPPNFAVDVPRLSAFLAMLREMPDPPRTAFEFRHESWFREETHATLREHECALCIAESDDLETPEIYTALHVAYRLRRTDYSATKIAALAAKFRAFAGTRSIYAYFKHVDEPVGPLRASALRATLGIAIEQTAENADDTIAPDRKKAKRGDA